MELSDLDKLIADRQSRIKKRKDDGSLFEDEVARERKGDEDQRLDQQVRQQKDKMKERLNKHIPACPQCGKKMTLLPEQGMIVCEDCQVGMRIPV